MHKDNLVRIRGQIAAAVAVACTLALLGPGSGLSAAQEEKDPRFEDQWWLHNVGEAVKLYAWSSDRGGGPVSLKDDFDIDAPEGWAMLRPEHERRTIRVAILSTGIDRDHPDLDQNKVAACAGSVAGTGIPIEGNCRDLYPFLAGTMHAGVIAAKRGNGIGVAGIAPEVELAIFKFIDDLGGTTTGASADLDDYYAGLSWATDPELDIDILVLPIGTPTCRPDPKEEDLLRAAHDQGVLIVAEAGERYCVDRDGEGPGEPEWGGTGSGDAPVYPSAYDFVLSVGGTNGLGQVWADSVFLPPGVEGSTCNSTVDILAPAEGIWSTDVTEYGVLPYGDLTPSDGTTNIDAGTEQAASIVAGVAALVMSQEDLSNVETIERLIATASPVEPHPYAPTACTGLGQVNLASALATEDGRDLPSTASPKARTATSKKAARRNPRSRSTLGARIDLFTTHKKARSG